MNLYFKGFLRVARLDYRKGEGRKKIEMELGIQWGEKMVKVGAITSFFRWNLIIVSWRLRAWSIGLKRQVTHRREDKLMLANPLG